MFSRTDVQDVMKQFVLVQLYCDYVPKSLYPEAIRSTITNDKREEDGHKNSLFERERFGTAQQPLYAIIEPTATDFVTIDTYDVGLITNVPEYIEFLKAAMTKPAKK